MKQQEIHETVASLAGLLKQTTEKRLVWPEGAKINKPSRDIGGDNAEIPLSDYAIIEPTVEYHNVLFSPEQVEMIKRKFLKLVDLL
jgi:hypothetical protein